MKMPPKQPKPGEKVQQQQKATAFFKPISQEAFKLQQQRDNDEHQRRVQEERELRAAEEAERPPPSEGQGC
jgi:hypothetical protein